MTTLILQPTDTSQWYTLIIEAQSKSQIILPEDTESYLVFLLMRSSTNTIWLDAIIGMDYMLALQTKEFIDECRRYKFAFIWVFS